jgi:hypothetical protein
VFFFTSVISVVTGSTSKERPTTGEFLAEPPFAAGNVEAERTSRLSIGAEIHALVEHQVGDRPGDWITDIMLD